MRGRGPRGLSLEECCLYLKTHISHTAKKKMGASHSHHGFIASLLATFCHFLKLHFNCLTCFFPIFSFLSIFFSPFYPSLHSMFCSPPFRFCHRNSVCHLNFIPSFSCPFFPTRHAHLCVSCMFCDSQTIIFFHGPGNTRIA